MLTWPAQYYGPKSLSQLNAMQAFLMVLATPSFVQSLYTGWQTVHQSAST